MLDFGVLSHHAGRQVTTLRSLPGVGRELSFNKLYLTVVCFHLHAGMQVPFMMEPAKTTSSNYIYSMVSPLFLIRAS